MISLFTEPNYIVVHDRCDQGLIGLENSVVIAHFDVPGTDVTSTKVSLLMSSLGELGLGTKSKRT